LIFFLLRYKQKVTEKYLSKVTRYFYFVTWQHWKLRPWERGHTDKHTDRDDRGDLI